MVVVSQRRGYMLFSDVERGQFFTFGCHIYMKTDAVVDYDNANKKYNAVVIKSDTGSLEGCLVKILDDEGVFVVTKDVKL